MIPDNNDAYEAYERDISRTKRLNKRQTTEEKIEKSDLPFFDENVDSDLTHKNIGRNTYVDTV